ncbi:hypothetical protein, partial [Endozoicomonas sp. SESOKO2]|uniref:hypothetical protein n=1 Tax=Endozoicomonas sp. SESOKO2 TaxID=2828743 RepID=UPI002147AACC
MTYARPNALSLAVAFAISSSFIGTQALADRKLHIKSVDILDNGRKEYTQRGITVRPTLGHDQQPILKSFTTTYRDKPDRRESYYVPAMSFTEILAEVTSDVSSVDLFETDENGVAQKYTKVLKVGDEGVFRFTHNLGEKELVIEVRGKITVQDSIEFVRRQSGGSLSLDPLTKIAKPLKLAELLDTVDLMAGDIDLGPGDHYVPLATIEVEKVAVKGRTFMRLIASGDQPPELQRLGQSLFVNDEALLAAATSAYIQVHILEEDLQQQALNELLAHSKPVGYVVHVEDDTQVYTAPAGYPKLEVTEALEEVIVFRGQKQYPNNIAVVEKLHKLWEKDESDKPAHSVKKWFKSYDIQNYRYVIRSRQMAVLEELAAHHDTEFNEHQLKTLAYYESLQQALTIANPDNAYKFEFTPGHIRAASSAITPCWLQLQLVKHFSFKPALGNLLVNPHFIQNIQKVIPDINDLHRARIDAPENDIEFASRITVNMVKQLIENESKLQELWTAETQLFQLRNQLKLSTEQATASKTEKLRAQQLRLEKHVHDVIADAIRARNTQLAAELGIDNPDDSQPTEEQARLIRKTSHEIDQSLASTFAATGKPDGDTAEATLTAIERQLSIFQGNDKDLGARFQFIQNYLRQHAEQNHEAFRKKMAIVEGRLGLVPKNEEDMEARHYAIHQAIQKHLKQQTVQIEHPLQQQSIGTEAEAEIKARYKTLALDLNINNFDSNTDIDFQEYRLLHKIESLNTAIKKAHMQNLRQKNLLNELQSTNVPLDDHQNDLFQRIRKLNDKCCSEKPHVKSMNDGVEWILRFRPDKDIAPEEQKADIEALNRAFRIHPNFQLTMKDIRTPDHLKAMPTVLRKLRGVERALNKKHSGEEGDVYSRRRAISEEIQTYMTKARQQSEEKALEILADAEKILEIEVNKYEHKKARLDKVRATLDGNVVSEKKLNDLVHTLWRQKIPAEFEEREAKLEKLHSVLTYGVEEADERALGRQIQMLDDIEDELGIDASQNVAAKERGKDLKIKLAEILKVEFEKVNFLHPLEDVLTHKIWELENEVGEPYDNEGIRRNKNNEIARQLNIKDYKDDASKDDQIHLIKKTLEELYDKVDTAGLPLVNERIAAIDTELDRQMALLKPKHRYTESEVAEVRTAIRDAETELEAPYRKLEAVRRKQEEICENPANVAPITNDDKAAPDQVIKKFQTESGLTLVFKQTTGERVNDIRHFLQSEDSEKHDEIVQKPGAATSELKISVEGAPDNLAKEDDFTAIKTHADTHDQGEVDQTVGELPETRKKYLQITKFLLEHDRIEMELTGEKMRDKRYQEDLKRQNQRIKDSKDKNPESASLLKNIRNMMSSGQKNVGVRISKAQKALEDHQTNLKAIEDDVGLKPAPTLSNAERVEALRKRQLKLGGDDVTASALVQLAREEQSLNKEVEIRKAEISVLKEVLKSSEEAAIEKGGFFQYTPGQANILADIHAFARAHSLKKQALEAAMGLIESAENSGKVRPYLPTFDFDDEFAPIHLQALVGDDLKFAQIRRIVEVFKNLKTTFMFQPVEDQSLNTLEKVQNLADWARTHIKTGPQEYDDEIYGMGEAAIHFVEHEPKDLKSFSEYFAARSASGYRIIALLREGLISKIELEHYLKAVRGVDDYQTVDEFEHFLGYRHGIKVPQFRAVVQMLSDEGVDEFVQSAFSPVIMTATGPAGMQESVAGMKEYAASVIANYVLDDIAFENGRKTAAFLANVQDTLTPYANAIGVSESELIKAIHDTLMQA